MPDPQPPSKPKIPPLAENLQSPPPLAERLPNAPSRPLAEGLPSTGARPTPTRTSAQPAVPPSKRPRATMEQEQAAEKHLREANVFKVRDDLKSAIASLEKASVANPYDPTPHSLRGDMLRNVGRPDDAILAYETAKSLSTPGPQQAAIENKIGRLVVENAELNDPDHIVVASKSTVNGGWVAVLASAFIPGLGQLAVGEIVKGVVVFLIWAVTTIISMKVGLKRGSNLTSVAVMLPFAISTAAWVYSVADSYVLKAKAEAEPSKPSSSQK